MRSKVGVYESELGVLKKEELKSLLNKYKRLFSSEIFSYLNSLIELNNSIVNENISDEDRTLLSELGIYEKILLYNIWENIVNIVNSQEDLIVKDYCTLLRVLNKNNYKICDFCLTYKYSQYNENQLFLYQTIENEKLRELTLKSFINKLEILEKAECPFALSECSRNNEFSQRRMSDRLGWIARNKKEIQELKDRIEELSQGINDLERENIENSMRFYSLILENIGIKDEDFEERKKEYLYCGVENGMKKTLIKTLPFIRISNNIKYL